MLRENKKFITKLDVQQVYPWYSSRIPSQLREPPFLQHQQQQQALKKSKLKEELASLPDPSPNLNIKK